MPAENTRRQDKTTTATTQSGKPSTDRNANDVRARLILWLTFLAIELRGAVEDHRKWINSDRARALGTTFEVSGRLLAYAAYIVLAYLVFNSFLGIRNGLATGFYAIAGEIEGSRVALFNILAAGLVGPIAIIAIGMGIGWIYNLTTATARRFLPRFVQPWVHPSIMFVVIAALTAFHPAVTAAVAKAYLYAKANIAAGSRHTVLSENRIANPVPDVSISPEATARDTTSERELVRLKSMFHDGRPCPDKAEGVDLNPQPEIARPEPGPAPRRNCQAEKTGRHE